MGHDTMPQSLSPDAARTITQLLNPQYPAPMRGFTDITRVLERDPASFRVLLDAMVAPLVVDPPDAILCVEACGFLFGAPMALALGSRLVLARRPGKLPRPTVQRDYEALGIGPSPQRSLTIHADAIEPGWRVVVVDDILASGGTVLAAVDLLQEAHGVASGVSVAVDLVRFTGRERIAERGIPLHVALAL
jgi:adenine phosphoribosyltransferase